MLLLQLICTEFCNSTAVNCSYNMAFSFVLYAYSDVHDTCNAQKLHLTDDM